MAQKILLSHLLYLHFILQLRLELTKHQAVSSHRLREASSHSKDPLMQCRTCLPHKHTQHQTTGLNFSGKCTSQSFVTDWTLTTRHKLLSFLLWHLLNNRTIKSNLWPARTKYILTPPRYMCISTSLTCGRKNAFHSDSGECGWHSLKRRHTGCVRLCPRAARGHACHPHG